MLNGRYCRSQGAKSFKGKTLQNGTKVTILSTLALRATIPDSFCPDLLVISLLIHMGYD